MSFVSVKYQVAYLSYEESPNGRWVLHCTEDEENLAWEEIRKLKKLGYRIELNGETIY